MIELDPTFDRTTGIGASEAAMALGVAPESWGTPLTLYRNKTGSGTPVEQNRWMEWGNRLEPVIASWYIEHTGIWAEPVPTTRHPEYPWLFATPDRRGPDRLIQIKTVSLDAFRATDKWGTPEDNLIPLEYDIQTQIEMAVMGIPRNDLVVLVGGNEPLIYPREARPDFQASLISRLKAFWKCVEDQTPPPPMNMADVRSQFPTPSRPSTVASAGVLGGLEALRALQADAKGQEAQIEALKTAICAEMGDAELLLHPDTQAPLATWKLQERKEYVVKATSNRVFRLK